MLEDITVFHEILPSAAVKLGVALLCGFLLGVERETKEKPAGLRTLILITVGSTLFMIVSSLIALVADGPVAITRVDPSRIASQVVTGIGFLGAGAIIQANGSIHGLTTAAAIWVAAGVGLCIGVGFPLLGIGITLLVLVVLVVLEPIRAWLSRRGDVQHIRLIVPDDTLALRRVRNALLQNDVAEDEIRVNRSADGLTVDVIYKAMRGGKQHLLEEIAVVEGVRGAPWEASNAPVKG